MISDPEKCRRAAQDLSRTANEFLAASWHVAASGRGAGAPITFDQASFLDFDETLASLENKNHQVINLTSFGSDKSQATVGLKESDENKIVKNSRLELSIKSPQEFRGDNEKISSGISGLIANGFKVYIIASAYGTLSRLSRAIQSTGIFDFVPIQSQIVDGFIDEQSKIAILTERDLTGKTSSASALKTPRRRRKSIDLLDLKPGDFVVHDQHGIGKFIGMRQRNIKTSSGEATREYLEIEYAPSKRNAPADKLLFQPINSTWLANILGLKFQS